MFLLLTDPLYSVVKSPVSLNFFQGISLRLDAFHPLQLAFPISCLPIPFESMIS
jgi:hypothetical protein